MLNRQKLLKVCTLSVLIILSVLECVSSMRAKNAYIGTFGATSPILQYGVDGDGLIDSADETPHDAGIRPSWLAMHPTQPWLYAVNENWDLNGDDRSGTASAFVLDSESGELSFVNSGRVNAMAPTHCSVSHDGSYLAVASFGDSEGEYGLSILHIGDDGALSPNPVAYVNYETAEYDQFKTDKCEAFDSVFMESHPHGAYFSVNDKYVLLANIGLNAVFWYPFVDGALQAGGHWVPPNSCGGPNHLAMLHTHAHTHSDECVTVYAVMQQSVSVHVLHLSDSGMFSLQEQPIPIEDKCVGARSYAMDIAVHPSNKYVYVATKGCVSGLFMAHVDEVLKRLSEWTMTPIKGNVRSFTVKHHHIYVAFQDTSMVTTYNVDETDGSLTLQTSFTTPFVPSCIVFDDQC